MAAFAGVACLAFAGMANAQTSNASAVALARANNQAVASAYVQPRNANGAAVSTDGAVEAGEDQSGFSNTGVGGAFDTLSGVGATGGRFQSGGALNVVNPGHRAWECPDQSDQYRRGRRNRVAERGCVQCRSIFSAAVSRFSRS